LESSARHRISGKAADARNGVVFVDETYGWLVGEKEFGLSFAYETADGGRTFAEVAALSDRPQLTRGISSDGTGGFGLTEMIPLL